MEARVRRGDDGTSNAAAAVRRQPAEAAAAVSERRRASLSRCCGCSWPPACWPLARPPARKDTTCSSSSSTTCARTSGPTCPTHQRCVALTDRRSAPALTAHAGCINTRWLVIRGGSHPPHTSTRWPRPGWCSRGRTSSTPTAHRAGTASCPAAAPTQVHQTPPTKLTFQREISDRLLVMRQTSRVWNFGDHFREGVGADWLSLPQYYKRNGYLTVGAGKLFHPGWPPENDQPLSWSKQLLRISLDMAAFSIENGTQNRHFKTIVASNPHCNLISRKSAQVYVIATQLDFYKCTEGRDKLSPLQSLRNFQRKREPLPAETLLGVAAPGYEYFCPECNPDPKTNGTQRNKGQNGECEEIHHLKV